MSVPLDRLYNFLHDICNHHDVIIYRFFPHGSRKLEDLIPLDSSNNVLDYDRNRIFYHDQEPLNFDLYKEVDINKFKLGLSNYNYNNQLFEKYKLICKKVMPEMNLKWAIGLGGWRSPVVLVHSEKRSIELNRYENIHFIGAYWWSHALIARDWFRYAESDPKLEKKSIEHDFLIYNRAWSGTREYRIKFAELLLKQNLNKNCLTWFSEFDNNQHYLSHAYTNTKFIVTDTELPKIYSSNLASSNSSADYNNLDYQKTGIEVVLETLFDDSRLHLTEKILRPIACGQPFILAATHGSLAYLHDYGFKTFNGLIDETYDTIQDPMDRLEAIVAEMNRIAKLPNKEKIKLYNDLHNIAQQNKQLFFSPAWQQLIINEYQNNIKLALRKLNMLVARSQFPVIIR